jgi:hypothetical protein
VVRWYWGADHHGIRIEAFATLRDAMAHRDRAFGDLAG